MSGERAWLRDELAAALRNQAGATVPDSYLGADAVLSVVAAALADRDAQVTRVRALLTEARPLLTSAVSDLYRSKATEWDRVDDAATLVLAALAALDGAGDEPRPDHGCAVEDEGGRIVRCRDCTAAEPTGDEPPTEPRCPPGLHRWSPGCDGHPERPL